MQKAFGTGAATNCIEDMQYTDCILVIGANPTDGHPVTGAKIKQRVMKGMPDRRSIRAKSNSCRYAKHHLQLRPGTNVALLNMFVYYIVRRGW